MIIKIISTLSIFLLLTTNTYAHSVSWSTGGVIILYGIYYVPPILFSFLIAYLIPKFLKKTLSGILKNIFVRALIIYVALSITLSLALWIFASSGATSVTQTTMPVYRPVEVVKLEPKRIPKVRPLNKIYVNDERCLDKTAPNYQSNSIGPDSDECMQVKDIRQVK